MTAVDPTQETGAPRPGPARRAGDATRTLLGPLWTTTFRDPVRSGRLRLDGLSMPERQLARAGLVLLGLLLCSLLVVGLWRDGPLLYLAVVQDPRFVPEGLVPVSLIALYLSLLLVVWGALDAAPSVRLVVAFVYAATVGSLSTQTSFDVSDAWFLQHGGTVLSIAFWVPVGALVLSALLNRFTRLMRWVTPVLRAVCFLAAAAMAVAQLGEHVQFTDAGFLGGTQSIMHSSFSTLDGLMLPLIFIASLGIIDFATDVSTSLATPIRQADPKWARWAKLLVAAILAVKLWIEFVSKRDYWSAYVTGQPKALAYTAGLIIGLSLLTWAVSRRTPRGTEEDIDKAKERLVMGGTALVTVAVVVGVVVIGLVELGVATFDRPSLADWIDYYPTETLSQWVPIVGSAAAVAGGLVLIRRGWSRVEPGLARELGCGLVILGGWVGTTHVVAWLDLSFGFSARLFDLVVTAAVTIWLAVRWRRVGLGEASLMLAVLVFSWLVNSRGDYISYVGGLLGLSATAVLVFGVLYTLLSGAAFTNESSKRLPRESRTLMFVGYLLLSITLVHWLEAIHIRSLSSANAYAAFYFLGLPLAAWLLVRRIVPRNAAPLPSEVQDDFRDPTSTTPSSTLTS